jgi:hypothetical protein
MTLAALVAHHDPSMHGEKRPPGRPKSSSSSINDDFFFSYGYNSSFASRSVDARVE